MTQALIEVPEHHAVIQSVWGRLETEGVGDGPELLSALGCLLDPVVMATWYLVLVR